MERWNLNALVNKQSKPENTRQSIVYKDPRKLVPSENNFYDVKELEKLKASIKFTGYLMQPILIKDADGEDLVLAGHRRRLCCISLLDEGDDRFKEIPCIYATKIELKDDERLDTGNPEDTITYTEEEKKEIESLFERFEVIQANNYRDKSDWEKMQEFLETEDIVKQMKKRMNLKGDTREALKEIMGISGGQCSRYKNISNNLSKNLMAEFREKRIGISVADKVASLKPELQEQAYEIFMEIGTLTLPDIKKLEKHPKAERDIPGQMTIEQVTGQQRPPENDTPIQPELQIERLFETLNTSEKDKVVKCNKPMALFLISGRYKGSRVRNGILDYIAATEGITFNPDSAMEHILTWNELVEELTKRFGKEQKPVKMVSIDAPEKPAKKASAHRPEERIEQEAIQESAQTEQIVKNDNLTESAKCITGQSGSGLCGAAAYCDEKYNCCVQCPDDCNGRCGWIPEKSCQLAAESADKKQQEEHFVDLNKMENNLRNTDKIPDAWPEELKDIPMPTDIEIIGYLYDEERELREVKKDPELPHMAIYKQQLIVAGLQLIKNLVEDCQKEPKQPELPVMRNNDQRKEWLRNYKSWGLWYIDKNTGIKYYKYDFENGARLIAEEYQPDPDMKNKWWVGSRQETAYLHLVGGPEPSRKDKVPKWTYHSKYNKYPNSETELVEFLKEIQNDRIGH